MAKYTIAPKAPNNSTSLPAANTVSAPRRAARAVKVVDPLVPLTHKAQKLMPYTGAVPSYVAAMDQYAQRAGLTARKLIKRGATYGDELLVVYAGTQDQIAECELIAEPGSLRWPTRGRPLHFNSIRLCPYDGYHHSRIYPLADSLFAIAFEIDMPAKITSPFPGVECFEFYQAVTWRSYRTVAYYGTRDALVDAQIAEADMFPDDGTEMEITKPNRYDYPVTLEESVRLHDGRWAYLKYPDARKELDEEQREEATTRHLADYKSAEEWLETKEDAICDLVRGLLSRCSVNTKTGIRYTVDQAALTQIRTDIEAVAQRIRDLPVKVESLRPRVDARRLEAARSAQCDVAFQRFMGLLPKDWVPREPKGGGQC